MIQNNAVLFRINKATPATWVNPTTKQIGLGENQIRLPELTSAQERIIEALYSGIVSGQEVVVDQISQAELGETKRLIELLKPALEDNHKVGFGGWNNLSFSEIARASLDYQVNGEMVLAERWQRTVHIDQLDKSGLLLTKALLASGVGKILSHDTGLVINTDTSEVGYPENYRNHKRITATREILQEQSSRLLDGELRKASGVKVSFAVTIGHLALNPKTYSRWLNRDVNHLAIEYGLAGFKVSPVIIPGKTACLNCYQESLVDQDEAWPVIASQLLDNPRVRDDSAALLTATGLAVRSILRNLDEQAGFQYVGKSEAEYLLGYQAKYSTGSITRLKFDKHQLCRCQNTISEEQGSGWADSNG